METNHEDDRSTSIHLLSEIAKTINRQSKRLANSVALYNYHQKIARPDQKVLEITVGGLLDAGALSDLQRDFKFEQRYWKSFLSSSQAAAFDDNRQVLHIENSVESIPSEFKEFIRAFEASEESVAIVKSPTHDVSLIEQSIPTTRFRNVVVLYPSEEIGENYLEDSKLYVINRIANAKSEEDVTRRVMASHVEGHIHNAVGMSFMRSSFRGPIFKRPARKKVLCLAALKVLSMKRGN